MNIMAHIQLPTLFWQEETISFQKRIEHIYDHLYANGSVRTPTGICAEVGKILHIGMYQGRWSSFRPFTSACSRWIGKSSGDGLDLPIQAEQVAETKIIAAESNTRRSIPSPRS